jgi:hypothetical protein
MARSGGTKLASVVIELMDGMINNSDAIDGWYELMDGIISWL